MVALPRFKVPEPIFKILPVPLIAPDIVKVEDTEKIIVAERLRGHEIVNEDAMDVVPAGAIVKVPVPEIEAPANFDVIVLQIPAAERTGLYATVPPKAGIITFELEVGVPTDQFDEVFQSLVTPLHVVFCALTISVVVIKKTTNRTPGTGSLFENTLLNKDWIPFNGGKKADVHLFL